jgi:hypothetical protein
MPPVAGRTPFDGSVNFPAVNRAAHIHGMLFAAMTLAACGRAATVGNAPQSAPSATLMSFATQRIAVAPTSIVRSDSLGWGQRLGGPVAAGRVLDSAFATALSDRGLAKGWYLPADLVRAFERNRSYATNPYELTTTMLRPQAFQATSRYGEPLASQLRTMVALHEGVRLVLIPVEARFEREGQTGRAIIRAVLLDARAADARWVGEIRGDTSSVPRRALENVASRFAELFVAQ